MVIKVKICGITNEEDATWAVNLGASYIGFNFWEKSLRKVSDKNAKKIIGHIPPFVTAVGVFVNAEMQEIQAILRKTMIRHVQLHGDEDPAYCDELKQQGITVIKAFRIKDGTESDRITDYAASADYILLDTYTEDHLGGTGRVFDWEIALQIKQKAPKPLFLAGGLASDNVAAALEKVMPYAADVCSGVERSPRRKDYEKMKEFILKVQEVF